MADKRRKSRPVPRTQQLPVADASGSTDDEHPLFCLRYLHPDHAVKSAGLDRKKRAAFAERLQELASQTWSQLRKSGRHSQGFEFVDAAQIRPTLHGAFADVDKVMVFRYAGLLPMVGVRNGRVYHVLAVEAQFGDVYDHG